MDRDNELDPHYYYDDDDLENTLTPEQISLANDLWGKVEEIKAALNTMVNYYPQEVCQHFSVFVSRYEHVLRNIRCTVEFSRKIGPLVCAILTLKTSIDQIVLNGLFNRICYRWVAAQQE